MEIEKIVKLAKECGLEMCVYSQPKLTDMGNGTLKFIQGTDLTMYGEKLIVFANLIEKIVQTEG